MAYKAFLTKAITFARENPESYSLLHTLIYVTFFFSQLRHRTERGIWLTPGRQPGSESNVINFQPMQNTPTQAPRRDKSNSLSMIKPYSYGKIQFALNDFPMWMKLLSRSTTSCFILTDW